MVVRTIERIRRWHALLGGWRLMQFSLCGLLPVLAVWICLERLLGVPGTTVALAFWLTILLAAASLLAGWRRRPEATKAAWLLDQALGSNNLFGTLAGLPQEPSAIRTILEEQALGFAAVVHPPTLFPVRCNRAGRWLWLPALLLVGALFLPPRDPFGWREQRLRQQARDRAVAAADAAIGQQLADPALTPAATALLQETRSDLAAAVGEQEAAAALAEMQQAAAGIPDAAEPAQRIMAAAAAAAGAESAIAAVAGAAANKQQTQAGGTADRAPEQGREPGDGRPAAENGPQAGASKQVTGSGQQNGGKAGDQAGGKSGNEPGQGAAADAADSAQAQSDGSPGDSGQETGDGAPQAGTAPGNGKAAGGSGIGDGGGKSVVAAGSPIDFQDLHVDARLANDKTIDELIRMKDPAADARVPNRTYSQATAAAAASASSAIARTRVPAAAASTVKGYFQTLADDAAKSR